MEELEGKGALVLVERAATSVTVVVLAEPAVQEVLVSKLAEARVGISGLEEEQANRVEQGQVVVDRVVQVAGAPAVSVARLGHMVGQAQRMVVAAQASA